MEEYWNDPSQEPVEPQAPEEGELLFDQEEPAVEEPPKPKKKRSFKKKVRRVVRRFMRLPLLTRIIALAAVVLILAAIIVLLIVLPKSCSAQPGGDPIASVKPSDAPVDTPEAGSSTPEPVATNEPTATPFLIPALTGSLKPGSTDETVVPYVRTRLVELGYMEMPEVNDGKYDDATVNAVRRFQCRNFDDYKDWDGWIGTKTYELLTSSTAKAFYMKRGDTDAKLYDGKLVTKLQENLIKLGYLKTAATGEYDDATVNAVKSFQRANSLDADGVAGLRTLQLIDSMIAASGAKADEITSIIPTGDGQDETKTN